MEVQSTPDFGAPPLVLSRHEHTVGKRKYAILMQTVVEYSPFYPAKVVERFVDAVNDDTEFHPDVSEYLPLETPKLTKAGKVAARQPEIPKKSVKWWRAQCGFRDLPMTGTIANLQARLRKQAATTMSVEMMELYEQMKREWNEKNLEKLEEDWKSSDDSKKAQLWPRRFLFEKCLATPERKKDVTVVRMKWGNALEKVTPEMAIATEVVLIPESLIPKEEYHVSFRDFVLGVDPGAVRAKAAELKQKYDEIRRKEKEEEAEKERKKIEAFDNAYSRAQQQAGTPDGRWDVEGTWSVSCPYIEEEWGHSERANEKCSFTLHVAEEGDGKNMQMYAMFEFIVLTGIMRFVGRKGKYSSNTGHSGSIVKLKTPIAFLLSEKQLPSSKNRKFSYRWRGEDTGTGEIELESDETLCSLEFTSPNTLTGTIEADFFERTAEFKAFKTKGPVAEKAGQKRKRPALGGALRANEEWHIRSEGPYGLERY